jgi:hypothetical protein
MAESLFNSLLQQKISERKIEESMLKTSCTELFLSDPLNLLKECISQTGFTTGLRIPWSLKNSPLRYESSSFCALKISPLKRKPVFMSQ